MGTSTSKASLKRTKIEKFEADPETQAQDSDPILVQREKTDVITFPEQSTIDRELLSYDGQLYSMFDDDDKGKSGGTNSSKSLSEKRVLEANRKMHEANKDLAERLRSPPSEPFTRAKDLKVPNRGGVRFGSEPEIIPDFLEDPEPRSYKRLVHASSTNNIASLTKRSTLKNSRVMGSSPNFTELSPRIGTPEARFARINGVPYEPSSELLPTIKPHSPYAKQTMKYVEEHFGADDRTSISLSDPEDYRVKSASPLPPQRSSLPALHDRNTAHWFNKLPTANPTHSKSLENSDGMSPLSSKLSNSSSRSSLKPKPKLVGGKGKPKKPWEPFINDSFSNRDNIYKGIAFLNTHRPRRTDYPP